MRIRNYIFCLLSFLTASNLRSEVPQLTITGPDGGFTHIELPEGLAIEHLLPEEGGAPVMRLNHSAGNATEIGTDCIETCEVVHPGIPALSFHFPDYPEAEQVWTKNDYINATLAVHGNGVVEDQEGLSLTVKGRGNSTWGCEKKPMRLKFSKKTSLCGFTKAKSYVLLANYLDRTHIQNVLALWLGQRLGMPYTNHYQHCDVFINNKYVGLYLLTEKIGINSASVDIDEEQGMLFEISAEYDEDYKFRSARYDLPVMVKDPDLKEMAETDPEGRTPEELLEIWKTDFEKAEEATYRGRGFNCFDLESFVNFTLVQNVMLNHDMYGPKSVYVHKAVIKEETKYNFGPIWDFDSGMMAWGIVNGEVTASDPNRSIWYHPFLSRLIHTTGYKTQYTTTFNRFYSEIYPEMLEFLDTYAKAVEQSAELDGKRWPDEGPYQTWTYRSNSSNAPKHISDLRQWLTDHVEYLKGKLDKGEI